MLDDRGAPCAGSLGVLVDDALGAAMVARRPEGKWLVTTELSIDMCSDLPSDGSILSAEGWQTAGETGGALAQGRVLDSSGRMVATGTARGRYIAAEPDFLGSSYSVVPAQDRIPSVEPLSTLALLHAAIHRVGAETSIVVPAIDAFANPLGNMHGGILLCVSELAGSVALRSDRHPLRTSSMRIAFLRPGPVTGDVTFTAEVLHRGRTLGVAHVTSRGETGKLCTVATITCHGQDVES
jgi:uncharacterized protein (TIGR00369 family)